MSPFEIVPDVELHPGDVVRIEWPDDGGERHVEHVLVLHRTPAPSGGWSYDVLSDPTV